MAFDHHRPRLLFLCVSAALLGACENPAEVDGAVGDVAPASVSPEDPAGVPEMPFCDWKTKAELQIMLEQLPQGSYFAAIEGRDMSGLSQYRAVPIPFDESGYDLWALYWGLDEKEFFDTDLMLLRKGFRRQQIQTFVDASGVARHQMVYLRPVGAGETQAVPEVVPPAVTANPTPVQTPVAPEAEDLPLDPQEAAEEALPGVQADAVEEEPPSVTPQVRDVFHVVSRGDTLSAVARKYGVTVSRLKSANALRTDVLRIGQKLRVPIDR